MPMEGINMNEILNDVKMHIEGTTTDNHFDSLLINYINTAFEIVWQLGVGPRDKPFKTSLNSEDKWSDFMEGPHLEQTKEYIYRRVQMMFDPPQSSAAMDASKEIMNEMEWRINAYADYPDTYK